MKCKNNLEFKRRDYYNLKSLYFLMFMIALNSVHLLLNTFFII